MIAEVGVEIVPRILCSIEEHKITMYCYHWPYLPLYNYHGYKLSSKKTKRGGKGSKDNKRNYLLNSHTC